MFQFPGFPTYSYVFTARWQRFPLPGFPIQISPDHWIFAPPRSLSRLSSALSAKASTLRPYYFNRSRNDRISWFSVSSLMYSVTSAGFVFLSFSYLVINDEIWISLMSWLISISENEFYLNSCMKFSRYIRVSETISCIFDTSGLIDHAIQECLFLDRIIDKSKTLL